MYNKEKQHMTCGDKCWHIWNLLRDIPLNLWLG